MSPRRRVVYSDLDGTMVGHRGCFWREGSGAVTRAPAAALADLLDAGVALVLVSGRTRPQLEEAARIFGADGFVGELGAVVGWDGGRRHEVLRGELPAQVGGAAFDGTPFEAIERLGVVEAMGERWPRLVEWHSPWHVGHEADAMLRGRLDVTAVHAWLAEHGWGWLRLHDNGVLPARRATTLDPAAVPAHVYHLMPAGLDKGTGVAADLARRGLTAADAVAVGDSMSDLAMAGHVGRTFVTANGLRHPGMAEAAAALPGVTVCSGEMGHGWVEAVRWALGTG